MTPVSHMCFTEGRISLVSFAEGSFAIVAHHNLNFSRHISNCGMINLLCGLHFVHCQHRKCQFAVVLSNFLGKYDRINHVKVHCTHREKKICIVLANVLSRLGRKKTIFITLKNLLSEMGSTIYRCSCQSC